MGKLELLVIHCTATPERREVTEEEIRKWHTSPQRWVIRSGEKINVGGRGWRQVGYSDMIMLDGEIINLVPYDNDNIVESWEVTNGVAGINYKSRHIVYAGGTDKNLDPKDTRTQEQKDSLTQYVLHTVEDHHDIKVAGHNQFANKACPSFNVPEWLRYIGIKEKNIYNE